MVLLIAAGLSSGACDLLDRQAQEQPVKPVLTLKVATPEVLYWGGSGMLHLTLTNEGEAMAAGGIVEVFVPAWLEFGTVEPVGTAVTVVSGDAETTLRYQLTDSLAPGDSRLITQHLRVLPRSVTPSANDSIDTMEIEPSNQLVRARLLTPSGEAIGVEVQAALNFVGRQDSSQPADTARGRPAPRPGPWDTTSFRSPAARTQADTTSRDTLPARR